MAYEAYWIGNFTQFLEFFGPSMKVTFTPVLGPQNRGCMFSHEGAYLPQWRMWLRAHKRVVSSLGRAMSPLLSSRGSYSRPPKLKGHTPQSKGIPLPWPVCNRWASVTIFDQNDSISQGVVIPWCHMSLMAKDQDPHSFKVHNGRKYDMPFSDSLHKTVATPSKAIQAVCYMDGVKL